MNLTNALKIQGFTNEHELEWLARQGSTRQRIVEIGAWKGRSTRAIADNTSGTVWAVDTWNGTPEDPHFKELQGKPEDWLVNEFLKNIGTTLLHASAERGSVIPVRMPSRDASAYLGGSGFCLKFDMIFIDADHSYEAVKSDIISWRPLLADGGLFCGHDYIAGRGGVLRAVDDFVPGVKRAGVGTIWVAP